MIQRFSGLMLALGVLSKAAGSQEVNTPLGVVEFVGLHSWTIQMIQDSMRVHAPGKPLGQCAGVLRSLGFPSAQSLGLPSPTGESSLVIVVEPQDSMLVRYRKVPMRASPPIPEWSVGYDILKNHIGTFQSGAQDFGVHATADTVIERVILQDHARDSVQLRSLWNFLESTRNSRSAALAERVLLTDASVENRRIAAVVLGAQRGRTRTLYVLMKGLRDPDERVASDAEKALTSLMTGEQTRIDWRPVVSDLRAILDGTNVLALRTTMQALTKTQIDRKLAPALLRQNGGLVIDLLGSHSPTHKDAAHEFLVWLAGKDLGTEPEDWSSWLSKIHARAI